MQNKIIALINYLRNTGLPVSPGETLDFARALQETGLRRDDVLAAALCTLAKDSYAYENLACLLEAYLRQMDRGQKIIPPHIDTKAVLNNPPRLSRAEFMRKMAKIKDSLRNEIMRDSAAGKPAIGTAGDGGTADRPAGASRNGSHEKPVRDLAVAGTPNLSPANQSGTPGPTNLREIDIAKADERQLEAIKKVLLSIGRKLAVNKGYRKKPAKAGSIDLRRTLRQAVHYGGIPLELRKEARIPAKPRIAILCDLSGSVAPYSEFFLQLLVSMQHKFSSLRSFAFVDSIVEITELARSGSGAWHLSVRKILREAKISVTGFSNYGRVWEYFCKQYLPGLAPQTTLIILGDARNNWQPDGVEYWQTITDRCHRTIWLNPLPRPGWQSNDCIINVYAPYCSRVFECRNANQLSRIIKNIL
ncbi:vWA domain-containing protein [Desulfoscipio geothermicus]|uniref:vWA domain-containing protein n=1 Tax=Desulfoscipio geothermicus TaxID=39060 RepID=UPI0013F4F29A|nr:VWA domain-containing protein [Desulfoscipio geothermicus]